MVWLKLFQNKPYIQYNNLIKGETMCFELGFNKIIAAAVRLHSIHAHSKKKISIQILLILT